MKKVILFALLLTACNPVTQPTPNGNNTNTIIIGTNPSSPTNSPEACLPVDRVRIVTFPSALTVGANAAIDVTPRDQFGNIRSDNCNEVSGNHWDSNLDVCLVPQPNEFRSDVRGIKAGTCELTACVAGHCDSVKFPVS